MSLQSSRNINSTFLAHCQVTVWTSSTPGGLTAADTLSSITGTTVFRTLSITSFMSAFKWGGYTYVVSMVLPIGESCLLHAPFFTSGLLYFNIVSPLMVAKSRINVNAVYLVIWLQLTADVFKHSINNIHSAALFILKNNSSGLLCQPQSITGWSWLW